MSSEITTAVEVGRSLYIYKNDALDTHVINAPAAALEMIRSNSAEFRHIQVSHLDWDTLLEWEDRVAKNSLQGLLDATWSRRLTVTRLQSKRAA